MKVKIDERGVLTISAETAQDARALLAWAGRNYIVPPDAAAFFRGTGMLVDARTPVPASEVCNG
jgi:hypothetical protein